MAIPTLLEADVLLEAKREFESRPELARLFGAPLNPTAAEREKALHRFTDATLKIEKDSPMWPGNCKNPLTK